MKKLILLLCLLATGCTTSLPTETQPPRAKAVIKVCFDNGGSRSYTYFDYSEQALIVYCTLPLAQK